MISSNGVLTQPIHVLAHVSRCELRLSERDWPFARDNAEAIACAWAVAQAANPAYFNGDVMLLGHWGCDAEGFHGHYLETNFASYLHWRQAGFGEAGVRDGFGACILRSCEGHFLLGRAIAGTMNAGCAYFISGFLDRADIAADGRVDIDHAIVRELAEETGLDADDLQRQPGYLIAGTSSHISIGVEFGSDLTSKDLRQRILGNIARQQRPELADIVIVKNESDLDPAMMPSFAIETIRHLWRVGSTEPTRLNSPT